MLLQRRARILWIMLGLCAGGCVIRIPNGSKHDVAGAQAGSAGEQQQGGGQAGVAARPDAGGSPAELPLPDGEWTNVTANLAGMMSECGDLAGISAKPDEDKLIAGVSLHGLFASTSDSETWEALGVGEGSDPISNRPISFVYDPDHPQTWWTAGIYGGGAGAFRTTDNGKTFKALGSISHLDGVAIDFDDPQRQLILAGGHEQPRTVYRSRDGGDHWDQIGQALPEDRACNSVALIDAQTYLVGCQYTGEGIYRSRDAGKTWTQVSSVGGNQSPLFASDGSIYWSRSNGSGLVRSTDQGETWNSVTDKDVLKPIAPLELPDGRIAAVGAKSIVVSDDHGATWKPASAALPFNDATGFAYSTQRKAFFIKHSQCVFTGPDTVLSDAVMRFDVH